MKMCWVLLAIAMMVQTAVAAPLKCEEAGANSAMSEITEYAVGLLLESEIDARVFYDSLPQTEENYELRLDLEKYLKEIEEHKPCAGNNLAGTTRLVTRLNELLEKYQIDAATFRPPPNEIIYDEITTVESAYREETTEEPRNNDVTYEDYDDETTTEESTNWKETTEESTYVEETTEDYIDETTTEESTYWGETTVEPTTEDYNDETTTYWDETTVEPAYVEETTEDYNDDTTTEELTYGDETTLEPTYVEEATEDYIDETTAEESTYWEETTVEPTTEDNNDEITTEESTSEPTSSGKNNEQAVVEEEETTEKPTTIESHADEKQHILVQIQSMQITIVSRNTEPTTEDNNEETTIEEPTSDPRDSEKNNEQSVDNEEETTKMTTTTEMATTTESHTDKKEHMLEKLQSMTITKVSRTSEELKEQYLKEAFSYTLKNAKRDKGNFFLNLMIKWDFANEYVDFRKAVNAKYEYVQENCEGDIDCVHQIVEKSRINKLLMEMIALDTTDEAILLKEEIESLLKQAGV